MNKLIKQNIPIEVIKWAIHGIVLFKIIPSNELIVDIASKG